MKIGKGKLRYGIIHFIKVWLLMHLLKWWGTSQMDQWERWKILTDKDPIFVEISLKDDGYNYEEIDLNG